MLKLISRIVLVVLVLLVSGCIGPYYTKDQSIGASAPDIRTIEDVKKKLKHSPNPEVSFTAMVSGFITTPFKVVGICGWTDYSMKAEARGEVVQRKLSSDRFFTVDLKLEDLRIDDRSVDLTDGDYYIRTEVYLGRVKVPCKDRKLAHPEVLVKGRLVWDGDGHLEIHPESGADYRIVTRDPAKTSLPAEENRGK